MIRQTVQQNRWNRCHFKWLGKKNYTERCAASLRQLSFL